MGWVWIWVLVLLCVGFRICVTCVFGWVVWDDFWLFVWFWFVFDLFLFGFGWVLFGWLVSWFGFYFVGVGCLLW